MGKKGPQRRRGRRRLQVIKELIAQKRYAYSRKIQNFLAAGDFELEDLEHCILSATVIDKVEHDDLGTAIDGCKYSVVGTDTQGEVFYTCGKLVRASHSQDLYFFITAHEQN